METEDARRSVNVGAPVVHSCVGVVVCRDGSYPLEELEEVCDVAVHAGDAWTDDGSCNIVYNLVCEPESAI